jgi:hypothetical protein
MPHLLGGLLCLFEETLGTQELTLHTLLVEQVLDAAGSGTSSGNV